VWPLAVVVVDVDAEHAFEVAAVEDQHPVETLGTHGADEALRDRVRSRRPHRRLHNPDAFAAEHLVEGPAVLAIAVADQEPNALVREVEAEVARLLGDPGARGFGRTAGEQDASALVRDEKQRVVAAHEQALDGEEIAGDDARSLRLQELAPARPATPRRRLQTGVKEHPSHGAWRDGEAELPQFAVRRRSADSPNLDSRQRAAKPARAPQHRWSDDRIEPAAEPTCDARARDANEATSAASPPDRRDATSAEAASARRTTRDQPESASDEDAADVTRRSHGATRAAQHPSRAQNADHQRPTATTTRTRDRRKRAASPDTPKPRPPPALRSGARTFGTLQGSLAEGDHPAPGPRESGSARASCGRRRLHLRARYVVVIHGAHARGRMVFSGRCRSLAGQNATAGRGSLARC